MAMSTARGQLHDLLADRQRLLPLGGATLLLLLGLFCTWQTWLIASERGEIERVHAAQDQVVRSLAAEIASERSKVEKALAARDPAVLMSDPVQAATALHLQLPQIARLEFYSADMNEVLHADYREFGYAKAAQLLSSQGAGEASPVQSIAYDHAGRRLSLVVPLGSPQHVQGWAWIELSFAPLQRVFESIPPAGGRLVLQQGEDQGDMQLLSHGAASAEEGAAGKPVPGSTFSVKAGLPAAFIVLPRSWPLSALLSLLGLGGGVFFLRLRKRLRERSVPEPEELELPARIERTPTPAPVAPVATPAAPPTQVAVDQGIFRAYDVRGVVGKTLNNDVARALGQSIGMLMRDKGLHEIVVGRDGRLSGPGLVEALSDGLRATGIDVIDVGAVPTPVVYYATYLFNTGCGVAVTGSHNPPDYNGFKIVIGSETLAEGAIQDLYQRIASGALAHDGQGSLRQIDVAPDYVEKIVSDVLAERRLKIVVDCGNGIPGALAPQVLEGVGCEVIPLYCDVDGTFPNHHPDPSDPKNLEDLILAVKQTGADLGLAFDGDGDRLGVVTHAGEIVYPDRLLMLFARDVLSRQPGATIIYDVKCTSHLKGQILDAGGSPLMWRTGHSLIKAKMRETGAELAGEMSGHFFFKERWYGFDDGIYAAARLLEILAGDLQGRTPEEIFATLPKSVSTPELKIELGEGEHYRFMDKLRQRASFDDATLITIDGLRADWPDGWGLVRASNTTPVLVLRFEADNPLALKRIQQIFRTQLLAVDSTLKLPF
ncbi:MAG TPA: phosphomannomutase/phosphoglucomutase [Rhodanobacter sp.]|nr:phosphomannomutase/phosphoglucomutase [Rhodanobacter sp.]